MARAAARLTVGIPTFNRSAWLRQAIASVLAQSFTGLRLIVSDNASEDDTAEVVRAFDDPRLEYRRNATNLGSIANLNALIAAAQTEFVMLLPDDDLLHPEHLEACVRALDRFPSAGLAHSGFELIDAGCSVVGTRAPLGSGTAGARLETREHALRRLMTERWPICFSSVVYRTEAIVGAGALPDCGPFADLQLWLRMTRDWDFLYLPATLASFRLHEHSVSTSVCASQDLRGLRRRHAQMRREQRSLFLDHSGIEPRRQARLRSLAELSYLLEIGHDEPSLCAVMSRLRPIVRRSPRVLLRPGLWRLMLARLGGSRARAALRAGRRAASRHALIRRWTRPRAAGALGRER